MRPGHIVAAALPRGSGAVPALLGALAAGAAIMPLDPDSPAERLSRTLEQTGTAALVTTGSAAAVAGPGQVRMLADGRPQVKLRVTGDPRRIDGACYMLTTSGSAGEPKATVVSAANVFAYRDAMASVLELSASDRVLHTAAFTFSSAMRQLLLPLEAGALVRIVGPGTLLDPVALIETVIQDHVTVLDLVPSYWRRVVSALEADLGDLAHRFRRSSLRLLLSASEPLAAELALRLLEFKPPEARLANMYGQTETTGIVSARTLDRVDSGQAIIDLGVPLPGIGIALADDAGPVPCGHLGEVVVSGPTVGSYLNAGSRSFGEVVIDDAPVPVFRTGDLARRGPDGRIEYVGRADRQVKVRGIRVSLAEAGRPWPASRGGRAAVVADGAATGERELHAYVVPARDQRPTSVDLISFLSEIVPTALVPTRFTVSARCRGWPRGRSRWRACRTPLTRSASAPPSSPRDEPQATMTGIWSEVLQSPRLACRTTSSISAATRSSASTCCSASGVPSRPS